METASYSTKGFITGSSVKWIIIISQASLFLMVPLFLLGLHPFIVTAALLGAMVLGFGLVTGKVIYTIDEQGLTKEVEPSMLRHFWKKKTFQFFPWTGIRSFREGVDANRSLEEFHYVSIFTTKGKKLEINTKSGDKNSFQEFMRVFRHYVTAAERGEIVDSSRPISARLEKQLRDEGVETGPVTATTKHFIKEKPGFYQTPFAKFLTVFFIIFTIGILIAMVLTNNSRFTNIFRFIFIIVPGTAYMYYRVFIRKE